MQTKWHQSIRWQMIGAFLLSGVLAVTGVGALYGLARLFRPYRLAYAILRLLQDEVGEAQMIVIVGLVLFVLAFFLLTQRMVRTIAALNRAIEQVARGNFDVAMPAESADELGQLVRSLTSMTAQLKSSIAQERQAQQSRHELITSISHDLRTPLTAMLGYLELVEHDKYRDEVELRYYVGIAYDKCLQLKRMIDQLFEFTATLHGSLRLRPVNVNLGELLEQLAEEFIPALQSAGMHYKLVIPPERIGALVDPDLMVRVLENLVSNAIRYGAEGKQVDLELARDGGRISIRVANYGEPIPEWELPHLFETFYRVEKSRSARTGGSGLGLAIARNIVELHGGTITAYNESGRTVFEIRLPGPS